MKTDRPMRDMVITLASAFGIRRAEVLKYLTPIEFASLAFEAGLPHFLRAQAEVEAGRRESIDAIIERGVAHAQLEADYAEICAEPLTVDDIAAVLASVPGDTSVVVAMAREVA
jgi:hypothetical protein